jgi:quinone-modifying oxidoreductase subunit QmoB
MRPNTSAATHRPEVCHAMNQTPKTLIIGSGNCALQIARHLSAAGASVIVADSRPDIPQSTEIVGNPTGSGNIEIMASARLTGCTGFVNSFEAVLARNGQHTTHAVAGIVVAEDYRRKTNHDALGLRASKYVASLSDLRHRLTAACPQQTETSPGQTIVFLNGLAQENTPVIAGEVMLAARELQRLPGVQAYVLTVNLKVAADGLERLYHETKTAGVFFVKFSETLPQIEQADDGRVTIVFEDEASGHMYRLRPDLTVLDEIVVPSQDLDGLSRILNVDSDSLGFLQTENVHRLPVFTNRRGILAAGPARAVMTPAELAADAAAAAAAVLARTQLPAQIVDKASIDTGQCIRCLTCLRLCPYRSVRKDSRISVVAEACEGCGICVAECPREAITMGESGAFFDRRLVEVAADASTAAPWFLAVCCSRSAGRAGQLAEHMGYELPEGLKMVEVPCAGSLSVKQIMGALASGAGGVLVLTCHVGNCHSESGNLLAQQRVELLRERLGLMGRDPDRLQRHTLAANMPAEFADIVRRFGQRLRTMTTN